MSTSYLDPEARYEAQLKHDCDRLKAENAALRQEIEGLRVFFQDGIDAYDNWRRIVAEPLAPASVGVNVAAMGVR
jgi:hypothetical protein